MKNTILLIILLLATCSLTAQNGLFKRTKADNRVSFFERQQIKSICKGKKISHSPLDFFEGAFRPKLSINILEGSGIHLFSISENALFPSMNVGAKFSAGIIITI